MQVMQKNMEVLLGDSVNSSSFSYSHIGDPFQSHINLMLINGAVSQFTLYGILKGNKPDFHVAMPPGRAKAFYESVVEKFRKAYKSDAVKGKISFHLHFF